MNGLKRTQDEIVQRIREVEDDDFFGFRTDVLIQALDFEHARPLLKSEITPDKWADYVPGDFQQAAKDYYAFAVGKIRDHRGLSAQRSIDKLGEYAWLLGRDDVVTAMEAADYPQYGAPQVKAFGEGFGLTWPDSPEMVLMAAGEPCTPDCGGCGR